MSTTYQVTIDIKEDGVKLPGFPIVKSVTVASSTSKLSFMRIDNSGTYVELPFTEIGDLSLLLVQTDQATTLRFNDQSDGGLPLAANGLFLVLDTNISSEASSKASLDNGSGSASLVTMIAGGGDNSESGGGGGA